MNRAIADRSRNTGSFMMELMELMEDRLRPVADFGEMHDAVRPVVA